MSRSHDPAQQAALRRLLKPQVQSGNCVCPRCGEPIAPRQHWDAGHRIDISRNPAQKKVPAEDLVRDGLVVPEHRKCNRAAGAALGNRKRANASRKNRVFSEDGEDPAISSPIPPQGMREKPAHLLSGPPEPTSGPVVRDGLTLPRLETPGGGDSLGDDAVAFIEEYRKSAGGQSFARRAIVCADRDRPGTVVQIMFFDSAADAEANNNLEITQAAAAEFSARVGEVRFQNLDLVADITV